MRKKLKILLKTILVIYVSISLLIFVFQEKLIFIPQKLETNYQFSFDQKFEEIDIKTQDGVNLNGLLFKSDSTKGLIFYLHGNAGSLRSWGGVAKTYTALNYDVFMLDYRGYGKSEGSIRGQSQLFSDIQIVYENLTKQYNEDSIIVLGYSIGTGLAAKIASSNDPKLLILEAPYYNLTDMMRHLFPIIPTFILKYKFKTNEFIKDCSMPIIIFHGNNDEVIYYESSVKLKNENKEKIRLITLDGQRHNGISTNLDYQEEIQKILSE